MSNCRICRLPLGQHAVEVEMTSKTVDTVRDADTGPKAVEAIMRVCPDCYSTTLADVRAAWGLR